MDECDLDSPTNCVDESSEEEESGSSDATGSGSETADDGTESTEHEDSEHVDSDWTESVDEESEDDDSDSISDTGSASGSVTIDGEIFWSSVEPSETGTEDEDEEGGSCVGACCHGGSFVEECVGQPCDPPIDYDYESKAAPLDPKSPYYSEIQK